MDCGIETCAAFFDLKKVFDSVPHRKLISNLKSLQLNPALTKWICSYLSGRYQRRVVEGAISQVVSGVQQGSVLGPLLFLLYIDNLSHLPLSRGTKMVLYADDRVTLQGYTVEPPIKDTSNKEHLSIKDKSTCPNSYYTSTF